MERFYYYVVAASALWEVRFDGQPTVFLYETREQAIAAAGLAARRNADNFGQPSGVKVENVHGELHALLANPDVGRAMQRRNERAENQNRVAGCAMPVVIPIRISASRN